MPLNELLNSPCEWLRGEGPDNDIVMSSRIRLARNLNGYPFTQKLSKDERVSLIKEVKESMAKCSKLKETFFLMNQNLTEIDKQFLVERHLISTEHAIKSEEAAICLTKNEIISVMILEEDHLRVQVLQSGFDLENCWKIINKLDSELEERLSFAFNNKLGYLTACPTNVGTGLRASCMMHLPSLVMTKQINKVLQAMSKLNLAVRGLYGEGTEASGNFFQISNQSTLGQSEQDIIDSFSRVIKQVIDNEREARKTLTEKKQDKFFDQIWRALGILKSARIISSREATGLLSMLRLGVDLNIIKNLDREQLNKLVISSQPAHLQKRKDHPLSSSERDVERAGLIRSSLKNVEI